MNGQIGQIVIVRAENGFSVQAGCMSLVFSPEEMVKEFTRWVRYPEEVEKEYLVRFRPGGMAVPTSDGPGAGQRAAIQSRGVEMRPASTAGGIYPSNY